MSRVCAGLATLFRAPLMAATMRKRVSRGSDGRRFACLVERCIFRGMKSSPLGVPQLEVRSPQARLGGARSTRSRGGSGTRTWSSKKEPGIWPRFAEAVLALISRSREKLELCGPEAGHGASARKTRFLEESGLCGHCPSYLKTFPSDLTHAVARRISTDGISKRTLLVVPCRRAAPPCVVRDGFALVQR